MVRNAENAENFSPENGSKLPKSIFFNDFWIWGGDFQILLGGSKRFDGGLVNFQKSSTHPRPPWMENPGHTQCFPAFGSDFRASTVMCPTIPFSS